MSERSAISSTRVGGGGQLSGFSRVISSGGAPVAGSAVAERHAHTATRKPSSVYLPMFHMPT
eukprot:2289684-Prymnesium_polylepis.1